MPDTGYRKLTTELGTSIHVLILKLPNMFKIKLSMPKKLEDLRTLEKARKTCSDSLQLCTESGDTRIRNFYELI